MTNAEHFHHYVKTKAPTVGKIRAVKQARWLFADDIDRRDEMVYRIKFTDGSRLEYTPAGNILIQ